MKVIKRKTKKILSYFFRPIINVFYSEKIINIIKKMDPIILNKNRNSFFTIHLRPSICESVTNSSKHDYSDYGIVIQGPMIYDNDFTLNTVKYYSKVFRNAKIILSTWKGIDEKYLEKIKSAGAEVILNEYPENSGILNINYQITNTRAAVNHLKNKCNYILKTRSDTRIYTKDALLYLSNMLKTFPSNHIQQKNRIIGIDINTSKLIPFSFSDVMQFGSSDDIHRMWNIDLCEQNVSYSDFFSNSPKVKDIYYNNNPEVYLTLNYLEMIGYKVQNTYESYYKALGEFFIIVDKEMLNFYWQKYSIDEYYWTYKYKDYNLQEKIRFNDWLLLKNRDFDKVIDYSYFDKKL